MAPKSPKRTTETVVAKPATPRDERARRREDTRDADDDSKKDGAYPAVSIRGDTLRGWMRRVMTRCGVDPVFTGGSIRQAASSKAINDGWEPAAVLELGMWKSFAMWNRFYNRSRLSMSTGFTSLCSGL